MVTRSLAVCSTAESRARAWEEKRSVSKATVYPICCKSRFMGLYTSMVYPKAFRVQMKGILRMQFVSFLAHCCWQDVPVVGGRRKTRYRQFVQQPPLSGGGS